MSWLLDACYLLGLALASPWLLYALWFQGKYRDGWSEIFLGAAPERSGPERCAWFHAVSLGEVNLLIALVPRFEAAHPGWKCVISTTTLTGWTQARAKFPGHTVFYAPFDFSWAVASTLDRVRPDVLVLTELELWPNWIAAAQARGIPIAVVNGRLSDRSFQRYGWLSWMFHGVFAALDLVAAQNEEYAERFRQLGVAAERVHTTGSIKFDGARNDRHDPAVRRLAELAGLERDDCVFLAGSTQEGEEALALDAFQQLAPTHPNLRLLLVPRHPQRFDDVARLLASRGVAWQRRSQLPAHAGATNAPRWQVLLVDSVGELSAWWGVAQIAFVGGSMGTRGGQNMIEPAAFGAATCFGPRTENFRDVVGLLLSADAARVVHDGNELTGFVQQCLESPEFAAALGQRARTLALQQRGATDATVQLLAGLVPSEKPPAAFHRAA